MAEKRKFLLRIDSDLWDDLQSWAADELRSVNGQIEYILREAARKRRGARDRRPKEDGPGEAGPSSA